MGDHVSKLGRSLAQATGAYNGFVGSLESQVLTQARRGVPSVVTDDLSATVTLTGEEIRERMSGNLCRCGAHNGIIDAIRATVAAEVTA